jgi:hypothetical protein
MLLEELLLLLLWQLERGRVACRRGRGSGLKVKVSG